MNRIFQGEGDGNSSTGHSGSLKGGEGRALGLSREGKAAVEMIVLWRTDGNGG